MLRTSLRIARHTGMARSCMRSTSTVLSTSFSPIKKPWSSLLKVAIRCPSS